MKDIDIELEQILIKYGIIQESTLESAIKFIKQWDKNLSGKEVIGLYGTGEAANNLLNFIFEYSSRIKIDICFDKNIRNFNYEDRIKDKNVLLIDYIKQKKVDYMIIGSYSYRKEIKNNLKGLGYEGQIVDIFELLGEYEQNHYVNYKKIFEKKKEYENASQSEKIKLLQEIIKYYFIIRDFSNAFKYIDTYVNNKYSNYLNYIKLKEEVQKLLKDIIQYMDKRSGDIIINWVDAVPYCERKLFPFLDRQGKSGIDFKNAYTVIPWTTDTMKTIMFGEYPIEGKLFLKEKMDHEAKLLKILKKSNYKFTYCGLGRFNKLFDSDIQTIANIYYDSYTSSIPYQWNAIRLMCQDDSPRCIIIHSLHETHEPFVSAEGNICINMGNQLSDWDNKEKVKQAEDASRYIDSQLEFYECLYGKNTTKIYMSDHGRKGNSLMKDYKVHINMIINSINYSHKEVEGMFSLIDFYKILEKIINNESDWESITSDYVLVQNYDAYNDAVINKTLKGELVLEDMLQCRGIITQNDKYFRNAKGMEYYYSSRGDKSEMENEIANEMYKDRIMELRNLCEWEYIDISIYEKFKYSHLLY